MKDTITPLNYTKEAIKDLSVMEKGLRSNAPLRGPLGKRKISYAKPVFYIDCYLLSVMNGISPVPA